MENQLSEEESIKDSKNLEQYYSLMRKIEENIFYTESCINIHLIKNLK